MNVSSEAGLADFTLLAGRPGKDHLLDSTGSGAAFLDFDRDGWLDMFLANGWRIEGNKVVERGRFALFRNRGNGTFENVTRRAGVDGAGRWGLGVTAADVDHDGWTDILVTCFGPDILYKNRGDGTFEDIAPQAGLDSAGWSTGAAFFDAEGDGDLDLYVAGYIDCSLADVLDARPTLDWKGRDRVARGPFGMRGAADRFFVANGDGTYTDATNRAGLNDTALAFGYAVRAADFDSDGDPDLFVANDSDADYLFRNDGGGSFKEVGLLAGCALNANGAAQASMGAAVGDVDGDGNLDIFVTTFAEDSSTLFRGSGGGFFDDATRVSGLGPPTYLPLSWGCAFADLDCDGDLDLVVASGHVYPQVDHHPDLGHRFRQEMHLFENRDGIFTDATSRAGPGFAAPLAARGLATGDYDNDGDLDLLVTNLDSPPVLLRNETSGAGAWITVALEDELGPLSAVGAEVVIRAGGRVERRDVAAGGSFLSTHDPRPHFGLGERESVDELEVHWPGGATTRLRDVEARAIVRVRRDGTAARGTSLEPGTGAATPSGNPSPGDSENDHR